SAINFPEQQFDTWAQQNYPGRFGTTILNTYAPVGLVGTTVTTTADTHLTGASCTGTIPVPGSATGSIPCSLPVIDTGIFNSSNFRNGYQYSIRVDKYFKNDRIYGSFFRTTLNFGGPAAIPQFSSTNKNTQRAFQVNYTHTFSPSTLNEAIYA